MAVSFIPFWKTSPFVRMIFPFVAGIVIGFYTPISLKVCGMASAALLIAIAGWSMMAARWRFAGRRALGGALQLLVLTAGMILPRSRDPSAIIAEVDRFNERAATWLVRLDEDPVERKSTWKAAASVVRIRSDTLLIRPAINLLLYFSKPVGPLPVMGEVIRFSEKPEPIRNSPALQGFDYAAYCARQNIYYQVFLKSGRFAATGDIRLSPLERLLRDIRLWVTAMLRNHIPGRKEAGLAEALLIGYQNDLDKALLNNYASAGVVHVIAISGLHLGFIYLVLTRCTLFLARLSWGRWLQSAAILAGLWLFGLLAGASPSILRSAVTFTTLIAGNSMGRRSGMLNSLAASAFILLWYNPFWLWDAGFQLSYGALTGILLFSQPIAGLVRRPPKIIEPVWKLCAVTLAAQLLTTPITIYYFRQFPLLFLLTNLIAVPLSTIVLAGELILCSLSCLPTAAAVAGRALSMLIRLMNGAVEYFSGLPGTCLTNVNINISQVLICYVFIAFAAMWLMQQDKRFLPPALLSAISFFAAGW